MNTAFWECVLLKAKGVVYGGSWQRQEAVASGLTNFKKFVKPCHYLSFQFFVLMKLPSVDLLLASFLTTARRFPLTLAAAALGTWSMMMITERSTESEDLYVRLLMTASLGLPLFFAIHVFTERHDGLKVKLPLWLAGVAALVAYFITLPRDLSDANDSIAYEYVALSAAAHLLCAFSAFYAYREVNGFWQFNKLMFLRFLTAVLYSGVLFLGLAGAILAVDKLFNVHIDEKLYLHLWFLIAGIFNTVFFLGGIPAPVSQLQEETAYPKGLKIFTQYVLIPLVTVYLMILYAYTVKIIFAGTLPKGWVANLILGFSVSGTLSLLLVWPIREHDGNDWIKAYRRFFYFSLIPLVVLLFVAIGKRVSDYGVTIDRYIVLLLGIWLALITLYFLFSKKKNIIFIPVSLFVFILISTYGPLSMFSVSERSQLNRLESLLTEIGAFENGRIRKPSSAELTQDQYEKLDAINSILSYLEHNHSLESVKSWMDDSCVLSAYSLQDCWGIEGGYPQDITARSFSFYSDENREDLGITISGYDRLYKVYASEGGGDNTYSHLLDNTLCVYESEVLAVSVPVDSIIPALLHLPSTGVLPAAQLTFVVKSDDGKEVKLKINEVILDKNPDNETYKVSMLVAYVLVKTQ